jgi:hypothetical protein
MAISFAAYSEQSNPNRTFQFGSDRVIIIIIVPPQGNMHPRLPTAQGGQ